MLSGAFTNAGVERFISGLRYAGRADRFASLRSAGRHRHRSRRGSAWCSVRKARAPAAPGGAASAIPAPSGPFSGDRDFIDGSLTTWP
jgi:hypothetical protein